MPKEIVCIVMNDAEKVGVFYDFFCIKYWMFFQLASHTNIFYIYIIFHKTVRITNKGTNILDMIL